MDNLRGLLQTWNKGMRHNKGDPWTALMAGILLQAIADLCQSSIQEFAVEAYWWMLEDGPIYMDALDMPDFDIVSWARKMLAEFWPDIAGVIMANDERRGGFVQPARGLGRITLRQEGVSLPPEPKVEG